MKRKLLSGLVIALTSILILIACEYGMEFEVPSYTVVYDANGGSGFMQNTTHVYGTEDFLRLNTFTRPGYRFMGWAVGGNNPGSNVVAYTDGQIVINLTAVRGGEINLYAVWERLYTVSFDGNGSTSGTVPNRVGIMSEQITLPGGGNLHRSGFFFGGWNTQADGNGIDYSAGSSFTITGNITLFAKWIVPGTTLLSAPTGVTATASSSSSITVSWDVVSDATGYRVYRSTTSWGTYTQVSGNITSGTSFTNTGLTANTTYFYRVTAYNANGESAQSITASATILSSIPSTPTGVTATATSSSSITVSWNSVTGATGYYVYRWNSSSGSFNHIGTISNTSFTNTGLTANTTYYYQVSAYNAAGESSQSSFVQATTLSLSTTRNITVLMRGQLGDSWSVGPSSLRISVNGVNISPNPTIPNGSTTATRTFDANSGDTIQVFWNSGSYNSECAFAIYYTDNPPSPAFNPESGATNNTARLLFFRRYGELTNTSTLLGTFTVGGASHIFSENFEGSTHAFTFVNGSATNQWRVGSAVASGGTRSAYISNNNGTSNAYTITTTSIVHMYVDVTFPASSVPYTLTFDLRVQGEGISPLYDYLMVFLVTTSTSLTAGSQPSGTTLGTYNLRGANWNPVTISIPAFSSSTTRRLVFTWVNDHSLGTQPPAAVDNIVIQ